MLKLFKSLKITYFFWTIKHKTCLNHVEISEIDQA